MIPPETRVQIRRYFYAEHWKIGTIAQALNVHPDTVRRAIEAERFQHAAPLRPSIVDPYLPFLRETLEQHPRLRATRLYRMIRDRGYAVERAIRFVRDSFWAGRTFTTLEECNRQALAWRDEVAHQRRWPDDASRTVAQAFAEEQPRLLPLPLHSFNTDRIVEVQSRKTIYVRFDLNDYSIPPEAVGRPLTLAASDTHVRILDGVAEIACHRRSYDRQCVIADPSHEEALLRTKRKALHATRGGRLVVAVPESESLLERAFAAGQSAGRQTAQLLRLLDLYGAAALRRAVREALERDTPRASSVAFLLRRHQRSVPLPAVDLSRHPEAQALDVRPHDLETYDELARPHDDEAES
jgi:hypothetical protein